MPPNPQRSRVLLDVGLLIVAALGFALVTEYGLASKTLTGGLTTGSDVGEHFWMVHALGEPGWVRFSHNRYPLPTLLARLVGASDSPFACWRQAAFVSTAVIGGGIWLWARALGGRAAGCAAVVLALSFPELVVVVRTVTAYPELLAIWTAAGAVAAWALARPSWPAALAAGIGAGAVFASDPRGLLVGLAILPVLLGIVVRTGWRGALGTVAPILLSWGLQRTLPLQPLSLEDLLEASVEMSYTRAGQQPLERIVYNDGYAWGRSDPRELPRTIQALLDTRRRINPAEADLPQQQVARRIRLGPLIAPVGLLLLGLPFALRRHPVRALALLPTTPLLLMLYNTWKLEYYDRYAALGMTACAVLGGVGLAGFFNWRPRGWDLRWAGLLLAVLLLLVLPTPLALDASWRTPLSAQADLQRCLGGVTDPTRARDECVAAMRVAWRPLASPWK